MPPVEEAKTVFSRLGYTVSGNGTELVAERKWRTVQVTAMDADEASSPTRVLADGGQTEGGSLRCFVTWKDYTGELRDELRRASPSYEWAIIGVDGSDDYDVVRSEQPVVA
jgi:hypothetical protein